MAKERFDFVRGSINFEDASEQYARDWLEAGVPAHHMDEADRRRRDRALHEDLMRQRMEIAEMSHQLNRQALLTPGPGFILPADAVIPKEVRRGDRWGRMLDTVEESLTRAVSAIVRVVYCHCQWLYGSGDTLVGVVTVLGLIWLLVR